MSSLLEQRDKIVVQITELDTRTDVILERLGNMSDMFHYRGLRRELNRISGQKLLLLSELKKNYNIVNIPTRNRFSALSDVS
jgi:hypothetical protein